MVEALAESEDALRRVATTCIALSDLLDKPYPDDPRWTPYTRFVKWRFSASSERVIVPVLPSGGEVRAL